VGSAATDGDPGILALFPNNASAHNPTIISTTTEAGGPRA
jgi:hypothetical protein